MRRTEADLIAKLESVPNRAGYIKSLIRRDLAENPLHDPDDTDASPTGLPNASPSGLPDAAPSGLPDAAPSEAGTEFAAPMPEAATNPGRD